MRTIITTLYNFQGEDGYGKQVYPLQHLRLIRHVYFVVCCNRHGDYSMKPSCHQDQRSPARIAASRAISQETKVAKPNLELGETVPEIHDFL
jgi:hypothetical protein